MVHSLSGGAGHSARHAKHQRKREQQQVRTRVTARYTLDTRGIFGRENSGVILLPSILYILFLYSPSRILQGTRSKYC